MQQSILKDYDGEIRPTPAGGGPTSLSFALEMHDIHAVDQIAPTFTAVVTVICGFMDNRLKFTMKQSGGEKAIHLFPVKKGLMWEPVSVQGVFACCRLSFLQS